MQAINAAPSNGYSVNILDMQTGQNSKASAAEEVNRPQLQPLAQQTAPSDLNAQARPQQPMTPAGIGQKINIMV